MSRPSSVLKKKIKTLNPPLVGDSLLPATAVLAAPAEPLSHGFAELLRASGMNLKNAAGYMSRSNYFGQIGFARGAKHLESLAELRRGRNALIECATKGMDAEDMSDVMLAAMARPSPQQLLPKKAWPVMTLEAKKKLAREWSDPSLDSGRDFHFAHVAKISNIGRSELIDYFSSSDMFNPPPFESWERIEHMSSIRAGVPPSMKDETSPPDTGKWTTQPWLTEQHLEARAQVILERFGLANIRISGMPSFEKAQASLHSLELAFTEIARGAGLPEVALGFGGLLTIHVNADVGIASGYCSWNLNTIALSPDNGWGTLAHEWFHAFDSVTNTDLDALRCIEGSEAAHMRNIHAAQSAFASTSKSDDVFGADAISPSTEAPRIGAEHWDQVRLAAFNAPMDKSTAQNAARATALALITAIREAPDSAGSLSMETILREETETSIERVRSGLFVRFYKNRVSLGLESRAEESFVALCRLMLEGNAALPEVSAWRVEHLGEKAPMCKHYDAFVVAERVARDARTRMRSDAVPGLRQESALQSFAKIADEHLAQATGSNNWEGYSTSAAEMSARGFEGNCFLDTPERLRPYLVDGRDNSLYWPVGHERGAHHSLYRAFLAQGTRSMAESGIVPASAFAGFDPLLEPAPRLALTPALELSVLKLEKRRLETESTRPTPRLDIGSSDSGLAHSAGG